MSLPTWLITKDPKEGLPRYDYPLYNKISLEQLNGGDILVHYGNYPWASEKVQRVVHGWRYKDTPGHVSLVLGLKNGKQMHLNQGRWTEILPVEDFMRSERRIDVVRWDITVQQQMAIVAKAEELFAASNKMRKKWWKVTNYDIGSFLWAGDMKLLPDSARTYICSGATEICMRAGGVEAAVNKIGDRAVPVNFLQSTVPQIVNLHEGEEYEP